MANIAPMLGAIMGRATPPDRSGKKRQPKPKARGAGEQKVTRGGRSVAENAQQHGELATGMAPKPLTDHAMMKQNARHAMRHATESWVSGHMTTAEHAAVHARAKHVLSGKRPAEFRGKSGERKTRFGTL